jgi:hypothetical protein
MNYREFFSPKLTQALSELMLNTFETEKAIEIDNFYEERNDRFKQFQKVSKDQLAKFNGSIVENKYVFTGKDKDKDLQEYEALTNRYLDKEIDFSLIKIQIKVDQISAISYNLLKPFFEFERKKELKKEGNNNA